MRKPQEPAMPSTPMDEMDIYDQRVFNNFLDDDEINSVEQGFLAGYTDFELL